MSESAVDIVTVPRDWSPRERVDAVGRPLVTEPPPYRLLVPLPTGLNSADHDFNIERLLRTATAITAGQEGRILFTSVVSIKAGLSITGVLDEPTLEKIDSSDRNRLEIAVKTVERAVARAHALDIGLVSGGVVGLGERLDDILYYLVERRLCRGIILQTGGEPTTTLFTREDIDSLRLRLDCDIIIESLPSAGSTNTLLVPVGEKPYVDRADVDALTPTSILVVGYEREHAALAAEVGRALAEPADATVDTIAVGTRATGHESASDIAAMVAFILGDVARESIRTPRWPPQSVGSESLTQYDVVVFDLPGGEPDLGRWLYDGDRSDLDTETDVIAVQSERGRGRSLAYRYLQAFHSAETTESD